MSSTSPTSLWVDDGLGFALVEVGRALSSAFADGNWDLEESTRLQSCSTRTNSPDLKTVQFMSIPEDANEPQDWSHIPNPAILPVWYTDHKPIQGFKGHVVLKVVGIFRFLYAWEFHPPGSLGSGAPGLQACK